ncbi:MAG: dockerin type I repeat-containing protein [Oscillospiraceae bacterium]|nr:dockerin type I repeat-containing protein [Oscillospiraceae bacterium]
MRVFKKLSSFILAAVISVITIPAATSSSAQAGIEAESGKTYNVIVLNFDPVFSMDENKKQHELMPWWNDPHWLADEFRSDMSDISYGYANYNISDWIDIEELPRSTDGKSYTLKNYYDTLMTANEETGGAYWSYSGWDKYGYTFDYTYYLDKYNVFDQVNSGEVDEVWIFTGPMVGVTLYETRMVGKDTYWCNSPELEYDCKPFVVYGFNYERGVGEMLEDAGHRTESIMNRIMGKPDYKKDYSDYTDWEKFTAYDLVAPGKSGVGNVHYAPNSDTDYDWGNTKDVYSNCEDWLNYPDMTADPEKVNCKTWGNGDIREHHRWWFKRLPHAAGVNSETGFLNNWWTYFTLDYINDPPVPPAEMIQGDVNDDGDFNIKDIVVLTGWILGYGTDSINMKAADLNNDDKINILDLCLMKQKLLYK